MAIMIAIILLEHIGLRLNGANDLSLPSYLQHYNEKYVTLSLSQHEDGLSRLKKMRPSKHIYATNLMCCLPYRHEELSFKKVEPLNQRGHPQRCICRKQGGHLNGYFKQDNMVSESIAVGKASGFHGL